MKQRIFFTRKLLVLFFFFSSGMLWSSGSQEVSETSLQPAGKKENSLLSGFVETGSENRPVIIANPESRSRITYFLSAKDSRRIQKYLGQYILVSGRVIEETEPWIKKFRIHEVIRNSKEPIEIDKSESKS